MFDAVDDFLRHDSECADRDAKMPTCDICGNICEGEHYWLIDGKIYCEECLDECRRYTEDYSTDYE